MNESAQLAQYRNVISELRQDLNANQKELSSKTKKLIQMENTVSSMKKQLNIKNNEIDELKITSALSKANQTDELYLKMEEYKNQINSAENEKKQIKNDYNLLQKQYNTIKQQYDNILLKYNHQSNEFNNKLTKQDNIYKQRIASLNSVSHSKIKIYREQLELIKKNKFNKQNLETENIKKSLLELTQSHDRIELDLNTQIEDMKDMMNKREKEKQILIKQLQDHHDTYKKYSDNQINELQNKLERYDNGDVEIILKIEVDDPILHKPPPKKPAPAAPLNVGNINVNNHSRQSSKSSVNSNGSKSSINGLNGFGLTLSPNAAYLNASTPFFGDVKSNPEFWHADHSKPNSIHHKISISHGNSDLYKFVRKKVIDTFSATPTPRKGGSGRRFIHNGAFPSTGGTRPKRAMSTRSSISSTSIFSDNYSIASSGIGNNNSSSQYSHKLSPSDLLNKNQSDLQKTYLQQNNTRLAEDLKITQKKLMLIKEQAHRKYKQLLTTMQAERRAFKLKELQFQTKLIKLQKKEQQSTARLSESQKKLQILSAEYNMRINNNNNNNGKQSITQQSNQPQQQQQQQQDMNKLISTIQSLETNNKSLADQCEKYRRELNGLKRTIINCNETMKQQQQHILKLNIRIQELRKTIGLGGTTSEELLQKQIRLLKSQRRMLIQELKDLRKRNEKLKNIIVTGQPHNNQSQNNNINNMNNMMSNMNSMNSMNNINNINNINNMNNNNNRFKKHF